MSRPCPYGNDDQRTSWWLWLVFILSLITVTTFAEAPKGGGFLPVKPSFLVELKVSSLPLGEKYDNQFSGVFVRRNMVLTCYHNVGNMIDDCQYTVTVVDHRGMQHTDLQVVAMDKGADLVLIKVNGYIRRHRSLEVSSEEDVVPGETVWSYGQHGRDTNQCYSRGLVDSDVTNRWRSPDGQRVVGHFHSGGMTVAMSGGPAVDISGDLIGINRMSVGGVTWMVSLKTIQRFIDLPYR